MEPASLAFFAAVLTLGAASPGPAVVAVVTRTLTRGRSGSLAFILGLASGDVLWLACAALGLAALAASLGSLFVVIRLAGAAYLLLMAWRLWTAPAAEPRERVTPVPQSRYGLYGAGLALSRGNPKTMAFYLALLPTLMDLTSISAWGLGEMSAIALGIVTLVLAAYVYLADRARRFLSSRRAMGVLNRICGAALAGAAVSVATK